MDPIAGKPEIQEQERKGHAFYLLSQVFHLPKGEKVAG